jgi:broad specificity phosphatase PhoE
MKLKRRIVMLRHGESEANIGMRSTNSVAVPLTFVGREKAKVAAREWHAAAPQLIVTSIYRRAIETADIFSEVFRGAKRLRSQTIGPFMNLSPSRFDGTTRAERALAVREFWARCDASYRDAPDSETFEEYFVQVHNGIKFLENLPYEVILVVTHGHFMQLALEIRKRPSASASDLIVDFDKIWKTSPVQHLQAIEWL